MIEQFIYNLYCTVLLVLGFLTIGGFTFWLLTIVEDEIQNDFIKNNKGKIAVSVSILCVLINIIILFL